MEIFGTHLGVTEVIAVCAILSPVITALFNNIHLAIMKLMEYRHLEKVRRKKREQEIYEEYLRSAATCIYSQTTGSWEKFAACASIAEYYCSSPLRKKMLDFRKDLPGKNRPENIDALANITEDLRRKKKLP